MRRRNLLLALAALAVVGLVCVWIVLVSGSGAPAITVRHVSSLGSSERVSATFEIMNRTGNAYAIYPTTTEALNGAIWQPCFQFRDFTFDGPSTVGKRSSVVCTYPMTNLPTGSPLRLTLQVSKEATGVVGFLQRLEGRFRYGQTTLSLNPFDKRTKVFRRAIPIFSDNFVEFSQEPKPTR